MSALTPDERALLRSTQPFTVSSWPRGLWAVASSVVPFVGVIVVASVVGAGFAWLLLPLLTLLLVRLFVMLHDAGHKSLVPSKSGNAALGRLLGVLTGVCWDAWRVEHDWHHLVVGRLDRRGVDLFNSPLTTDEARADPTRAAFVQRKVRPLNIAWLGALALAVDRKRRSGFFVFKPNFRWKFDDDKTVARLWLNNTLHLALHIAIAAAAGPWVWLVLVLPSYFLAAMIGASLFWVQHNFEHSVVDDAAGWSFVRVALQGSSHLRLPRPLGWFTGDIGLHHVHHLNDKIPHWRLEEARRALPALAAVPALTLDDVRRSYTHHFFDPGTQRRHPLADVQTSS